MGHRLPERARPEARKDHYPFAPRAKLLVVSLPESVILMVFADHPFDTWFCCEWLGRGWESPLCNSARKVDGCFAYVLAAFVQRRLLLV